MRAIMPPCLGILTRCGSIRVKDAAKLHALNRKLSTLFQNLGPSTRKEGWLSKKAEAGSTFSKRWCVLDSTCRLHYYKDQKAQKEQGVVDLEVATGAAEEGTKGVGFEIQTPGRRWVFHAESKAEQAEWMARRCDRFFCEPNAMESRGTYTCVPRQRQAHTKRLRTL